MSQTRSRIPDVMESRRVPAFLLAVIACTAGMLLGAATTARAQFVYQRIDTGTTRILDISLKIEMLMHEETETGAIADESFASTREERYSIRMLGEEADSFRLVFERFSIEGDDTDPEELKTVQSVLRKPFCLALTDSSSNVTLHGDSVSDLEQYFVETEYYAFMMEHAFSRLLEDQRLTVGDTLELPSEIASSLLRGMHFLDVDEPVTIRLTAFQRAEDGSGRADFSFSTRVTRSDESAYVELVSIGELAVDVPSGRLLSLTSRGTVEVIAAVNPSANRGSGTVIGTKRFSYLSGYAP